MRVNTQRAAAIAGQHPAIPARNRKAIKFWGFASGAVAIAGIAYAFFGGWYWALIGIVAMFLIAKGNQRTAGQIIIDAAKTNPAFEGEMRQAGILID